MDEIESLRRELAAKTRECEQLKEELEEKNKKHKAKTYFPTVFPAHGHNVGTFSPAGRLDNASISRYSRHLILPEIGMKGQLALRNCSVLIIGAGGLGCPAAVYLAAAGIGCLGLVDYDDVELNNLHRQILHSESRVGISKSASAAHACNELNSSVKLVPYHLSLTSDNALDIVKRYDIILDATDNVATRYLINDACVLAGKPLVSGSALRFEGQLTVYNFNGGPCFRCLFPKPPPPETVTNCSDGGVLGVVPGVIGCLQALETIKMATGAGETYRQRLLLFDALDGSFRTINLRPRQTSCVVCGDQPSLAQLVDYEQFCGAAASDKTGTKSILATDDRISPQDYHAIVEDGMPHVLVDVRQPVEMEICSLPNAHNIPLDEVGRSERLAKLRQDVDQLKINQDTVPVFVVCRRGNDSQIAVQKLRDHMRDLPVHVKDISGGLHGWTKHIDSNFPKY